MGGKRGIFAINLDVLVVSLDSDEHVPFKDTGWERSGGCKSLLLHQVQAVPLKHALKLQLHSPRH